MAAQRALGWQPQIVLEIGESFHGHVRFEGELGCFRSQDKQRTQSNGLRAAINEVGESAAHSGPGIDDVVHDSDAFAANFLPLRFGQAVANWVQRGGWRFDETFGIEKLNVQFLCHHLGDKRAFNQRAADSCNFVLCQLASQFCGEGFDARRTEAKQFEIQPKIAVMAGLEKEVAFLGVE